MNRTSITRLTCSILRHGTLATLPRIHLPTKEVMKLEEKEWLEKEGDLHEDLDYM